MDLSQLSTEQLEVYRDLLAKKQAAAVVPGMEKLGGTPPGISMPDPITKAAAKQAQASQQTRQMASSPAAPALMGILDKLADSPEAMKRLAVKGAAGATGLLGGGPIGAALGAAFTEPSNAGSSIGANLGLAAANRFLPGSSLLLRALQGGSAGVGSVVGQTVQGTPPTLPRAAAEIGGSAIIGPLAQGALDSVFNSSNARRLYQSALKPSPGLDVNDVEKMLTTGMKERIVPNEAGWRKANQIVRKLDKQAAKKVVDFQRNNPQAGIKPTDVAKRIPDNTSSFGMQSLPKQDMDTLQAAKDAYVGRYTPPQPPPSGLVGPNGLPLPAPPPQPPRDLTPVEAFLQKRANYRVMGKKPYGELKGADTEAVKGLSRGLKEELDAIVPGLKATTEREGDILELLKTGRLAAAVNRQNNRQLIDPLGATSVGILAHELSQSAPTAVAAGMMKRWLDNPANKARLAFALSQSRQASPALPLAVLLGLAPSGETSKDQPGSSR